MQSITSKSEERIDVHCTQNTGRYVCMEQQTGPQRGTMVLAQAVAALKAACTSRNVQKSVERWLILGVGQCDAIEAMGIAKNSCSATFICLPKLSPSVHDCEFGGGQAPCLKVSARKRHVSDGARTVPVAVAPRRTAYSRGPKEARTSVKAYNARIAWNNAERLALAPGGAATKPC